MDPLAIILLAWLSVGIVCLLITIFYHKFPPQGSDAIFKALIMVILWPMFFVMWDELKEFR